MLESAVATPAQQFGGQYLHEDTPAIAAAYAFHICMNHPFVDGNKRAAAAAMIAFLVDAGWSFDATADEAERVIVDLAAGRLDKPAFSDWVRRNVREKPRLELREFFAQVDPEEFTKRFKSLLPAGTGARAAELARSVAEAERSVPLLADLARQQAAAIQAKDNQWWDRVTVLSIGLLALYGMAEDIGYEW
jgi:death-on-curing protein